MDDYPNPEEEFELLYGDEEFELLRELEGKYSKHSCVSSNCDYFKYLICRRCRTYCENNYKQKGSKTFRVYFCRNNLRVSATLCVIRQF